MKVFKEVSPNHFLFSTETSSEEAVKLQDRVEVEGATFKGGNSTGYTQNINGDDNKTYVHYIGFYYFSIDEKGSNVEISEKDFQNLPAGFVFRVLEER